MKLFTFFLHFDDDLNVNLLLPAASLGSANRKKKGSRLKSTTKNHISGRPEIIIFCCYCWFRFQMVFVFFFRFDLINFLLATSFDKRSNRNRNRRNFYLLPMRLVSTFATLEMLFSFAVIRISEFSPPTVSGFNINESHETGESLICFTKKKNLRCGDGNLWSIFYLPWCAIYMFTSEFGWTLYKKSHNSNWLGSKRRCLVVVNCGREFF